MARKKIGAAYFLPKTSPSMAIVVRIVEAVRGREGKQGTTRTEKPMPKLLGQLA